MDAMFVSSWCSSDVCCKPIDAALLPTPLRRCTSTNSFKWYRKFTICSPALIADSCVSYKCLLMRLEALMLRSRSLALMSAMDSPPPPWSLALLVEDFGPLANFFWNEDESSSKDSLSWLLRVEKLTRLEDMPLAYVCMTFVCVCVCGRASREERPRETTIELRSSRRSSFERDDERFKRRS